MSETPNNVNGINWRDFAVIVLAGLTAFITAWNAFNGNDVMQNQRLGNIERVLCTTDEPARKQACWMAGIKPTTAAHYEPIKVVHQ